MNGIEIPLLANQFKVVPKLMSSRLSKHITNNVERCTVDFAKNELTVYIRQSVLPETFEAIKTLTSYGRLPMVELIDKAQGPIMQLIFSGDLASHTLELDYAKSGLLLHKIVWSIRGYWHDVPAPESDEKDEPMKSEYPSPAEALAALNPKKS